MQRKSSLNHDSQNDENTDEVAEEGRGRQAEKDD